MSSDYSKLVEALRFCFSQSGHGCELCPYKDHKKPCDAGLLAAAAIEALQKTLKSVQTNSGINFRMWEEAQAEVERLQAEVPKLGEWVGVSPTVDTVQCSVCGGQLFSAELETPYCPYCGAKMEVQDGQA